MIRVLFLGTPQFAVPALTALVEEKSTRVVGLVTQPDRPAGRGQRLQSPPVKDLAREHGIPIVQPQRVKDDPGVLEFFRSCAPDVGVAIAFGQILPASIFDFPPHGTLNIHASLLPGYRGAAPIARALLQGEEVSGVTLMRIQEQLDSGPILGQQEISIHPEATTGEVEDLMAEQGAGLLLDLLRPYVEGRLPLQAQDESRVSYAPMIQKAEARLDWSRPARRIHDQVRAFNPRPVAFSSFRGQPLRVWRTRLTEASAEGLGLAAGAALRMPDQRVGVLCGDGGVLELVRVQPPNRRRMEAKEFANGVRLRQGEIFGEAIP